MGKLKQIKKRWAKLSMLKIRRLEICLIITMSWSKNFWRRGILMIWFSRRLSHLSSRLSHLMMRKMSSSCKMRLCKMKSMRNQKSFSHKFRSLKVIKKASLKRGTRSNLNFKLRIKLLLCNYQTFNLQFSKIKLLRPWISRTSSSRS